MSWSLASFCHPRSGSLGLGFSDMCEVGSPNSLISLFTPLHCVPLILVIPEQTEIRDKALACSSICVCSALCRNTAPLLCLAILSCPVLLSMVVKVPCCIICKMNFIVKSFLLCSVTLNADTNFSVHFTTGFLYASTSCGHFIYLT